MSIVVNEMTKFILMLVLCKNSFVFGFADPKLFSNTDVYWKFCSIFTYSKFCFPYIIGAYTLPVLPISGPPFQIVQIPAPAQTFTIPPMLTIRPPNVAPQGPQMQFPQQGPPQGPQQVQQQGPPQGPPQGPQQSAPMQFPQQGPPQGQPTQQITNQQNGPCPPTISVCPPAALAAPIDPRQGISFGCFMSVGRKSVR